MNPPHVETAPIDLPSEHEIESGDLLYESSSTRIYLLRNAKSAIDSSRTGSVVAKKIASANPHPGQISRLYDEYILSKHLSRCRGVRAALRHSARREGFHALFLEWAPGLTVREWAQRTHANFDPAPSRTALRGMVALSWKISAALSEIHRAGVVHNNFGAENIIVDEIDDATVEGRFSVKVIDFGSASLMKENVPHSSPLSFINNIRNDICSLGWVLCEIFSGCPRLRQQLESANDTEIPICAGGRGRNDRPDKTQRVLPNASMTPLYALECLSSTGVPMSLCTLVANLITTGDVRYHSVGDVERDLRQMLVDDYSLFGVDPGEAADRLEFPAGRLYGRDAQISKLMGAFDRAVITGGGASEIVLISGHSGTGKSALARRLRGPLRERGGQFLFGKFDLLRQAEPLSAIISAFTGFCEDLIKDGGDRFVRMREAIKGQLGSDEAVLTDLIPILRQIIGGPNSTAVEVGSMEAQNRLKVIFRSFVRAIACPVHPIVLFLDDLQWADAPSLELLSALATDTKSKFFLFVGCYRDSEVDADHPLTRHVRDLEGQDVKMTKIQTDNIGKDDVNHLISDTLHAPPSSVMPLTDAVFRKTNGNCFFVIQLLRTLCDEGSLHFSNEYRKWTWDIDVIKSYIVGGNTFEFMTNKLIKLSADEKRAVQTAACLGSSCMESTLRLIDCAHCHSIVDRSESLAQQLDRVVKQGLMRKEGPKYIFVHDQIQLAAYALLSEREKGLLHLHIGNNIWKSASAAQMEDLLFVAVVQLNRGAEFIADPQQKTALAKLNLRAGKKAMVLSSFLPAAKFMKAGIDLLGPGYWEDQYALSLQLHELCAEAHYCCAKFDVMGLLIEQILQHARCFDDSLCAYSTLVNALGAQGKLQEAVTTALLVLEQLGEPFPDSVDEAVVLSDLLRTKDMLEEYTDEKLVIMRVVKDARKKAAMWFLYPLVWYTIGTKPDLLPLITVTLSHGACEISAFGFAMYGSILSVFFGDIERGFQFGQLSLALLERFNGKRFLARVYTAVFGSVNAWKQHIKLSVEPLLYAYNVGLRTGDIEFAMGAAQMHCQYAFECGVQLVPLEEEMRVFCHQLTEYKQEGMLALLLPFQQTVLNLMGHAANPLKLSGSAMDEEQMLEKMCEQKNSFSACFIHHCVMMLAYMYGDYKAAAEASVKCADFEKACVTTLRGSHAYYCGLTYLSMARKTDEGKWTTLASKAIEKLKLWATHASCNYQQKLTLLEAEWALLSGDDQIASEKYDKAIAEAHDNGFIQDEALANERAGLFHAEIGDKAKASHYFDHAQTRYLEWGARDKANHVRNRSLSLLMT